MPFPDKAELDALRKNEAPLEKLIELDAAGLLLGPQETLEAYVERLSSLGEALAQLEETSQRPEGYSPCAGITLNSSERIPQDILLEADAETERLYGFKIDWVPGFFLSKGVGPLWGGCALSFLDSSLSVFLIRASFAKAKRWFIYDREELLAHELCHVARAPLADKKPEEHFAYQTSRSPLRRHIGNCFQTELDAIVFILPVLMLLGIQITNAALDYEIYTWPFWIAALAAPAFLLIRNELQLAVVHDAGKSLADAVCSNPGAILFRCTFDEMRMLASFIESPSDLRMKIEELAAAELRWAIIFRRFMQG